MGKQLRPIIFEYVATHYCKYCHVWGSPASNVSFADVCGNCSQAGYLILNPFPDNMVPYIEFEAGDLRMLNELQANEKPISKLAPQPLPKRTKHSK